LAVSAIKKNAVFINLGKFFCQDGINLILVFSAQINIAGKPRGRPCLYTGFEK